MNYNLTSQLVAERQATLAQLKDVRPAGETSPSAAARPARTRRLAFRRPAHTTA